MTARIKLIGVELEGGWNRESNDDDEWGEGPPGLHADGSVTVSADYVGEISSPPLRRAFLESWVRENYPQHINASCGLHVHTSFCNVGRYAQLMDPAFYDYWRESLYKWGKAYPVKSDAFFSRLAGENSYCERRFDAEAQAAQTGKGGVRYAQLNYCHTLHGTLEARVLPMFRDVNTALAAINTHLNIIERWLARRPVRRLAGVETVELGEGTHREESQSLELYGPIEDDYMMESTAMRHVTGTPVERTAFVAGESSDDRFGVVADVTGGRDYVSYNVR